MPLSSTRAKDITGQKFNRWTAVKRTSKRGLYWLWKFKCECGNEKENVITMVTSGSSKSCGCLRREKDALRIGTHYHTDESKRRISEAHIGEKNYMWKGGITPSRSLIVHSAKYRDWRKSVFERDNYTCTICGIKNGEGKTVVLNADHIKSFAHHPKLRFDTRNGRTLCLDCHKKTPNYGGKGRKTITSIKI